jgi:hypothetical protein
MLKASKNAGLLLIERSHSLGFLFQTVFQQGFFTAAKNAAVQNDRIGGLGLCTEQHTQGDQDRGGEGDEYIHSHGGDQLGDIFRLPVGVDG